MTKTFTIAWALVGSFTLYLSIARGDTKPTAEAKPAAAPAKAAEAKPPEGPPKPGDESKKLSFFIGTWSGTGKLEAGAMGPGSKELPSKAKQSCKWSLGNFWVACDISDTAGSMTWMGHLLIGWDVEAKSYRAVGADNMGTAFELNGKMEEKKFTLESARESMMMGQPVKDRFTFDLTDPKAIKFSEERSTKGGPWQLAESVTFKKGG